MTNRRGWSRGGGRRGWGAPLLPLAYLQSLGPVYLRANDDLVSDFVDVDLTGLSGVNQFTSVVAGTWGAVTHFLVSADIADFAVTQSNPPGDDMRHVITAGNYASVTRPDANQHYYTGLFRGGQVGNANRLRVWLDGAEQTGGDISHTGSIPASVPTITAGRIGGNTGGGSTLNGTISLVVIYAANYLDRLTQIHAAVERLIA